MVVYICFEQRVSRISSDDYILPPFASLPAPANAAILNVSEWLFRLPFELFSLLEGKPETCISCRLDEDASDDIKLYYARNIDVGLWQHIHKHNTEPGALVIPKIWEPQTQHTPSGLSSEEKDVHMPTTLVQAEPLNSPPIHRIYPAVRSAH